MRLKKIDFSLEDNVKLAICEYNSASEKAFSNTVGLFGKNGVGKTRTLQAVYNTIQHAIKTNDGTLLENLSENAKSKVLKLNAKEILKIRDGNVEDLHITNENSLFDEKLIDSIGIQKYIITYGKSLVYFMGAQWYKIQNLSKDSPTKIFSDMFSKIFGVEFRTIYDPIKKNVNLEVNSLDIEFYQLSEGEWIAVFYLLLITLAKCTDNRYSDAIIVIDELENYLNPENIREIFNGLYGSFGKDGQIWIASHSLDILLMINSKNVYRLEKDKVSKRTIIHKPSINELEKIRTELYGNTDDVLTAMQLRENELEHFFIDFMTQSLQEPDVVACINKDDAQLKLFLQCLSEEKNVKMLDYGAGKGRIGDALRKLGYERLHYYAYDPNEENIKIINKKNYAKAAYSQKSEITEKFNLILVCNVLHEIEPWMWPDELNFIMDKLEDDGTLVFIEDIDLPVGEYIGETGFLLLDGEMTQVLFGKQNVSLIKEEREKYKDRILCAVISGKSYITCDGIIDTLKLMKRRNLEKVWQIRRNKKDKFVMLQRTLGTAMARAAQLVVNAEISINYLRAGGAELYESIQKFVACFTGSLHKFDNGKPLDVCNMENVVTMVLRQLEAESSEKWFVERNIALTGSLIERLNNILKVAGIKIYNDDFENLIEQYMQLGIAQELKKDSVQNLITELVIMDLKNRFC